MKKGFSLIEMLVVSALLIVISTGAITSFSSVIRAQQYALRTQYLIDQGNYVMDYMGRMLRMARREDGTINCLNYGRNYQSYLQGITFIFSDDTLKCKAFFLENGAIIDYEKNRTTEEIPLTASNVEVVDFLLDIDDVEGTQPLIKINLKIKPADFDSPILEIQTAISQRELNFPLEEE